MLGANPEERPRSFSITELFCMLNDNSRVNATEIGRCENTQVHENTPIPAALNVAASDAQTLTPEILKRIDDIMGTKPKDADNSLSLTVD
jgi:hypothetical protein